MSWVDFFLPGEGLVCFSSFQASSGKRTSYTYSCEFFMAGIYFISEKSRAYVRRERGDLLMLRCRMLGLRSGLNRNDPELAEDLEEW